MGYREVKTKKYQIKRNPKICCEVVAEYSTFCTLLIWCTRWRGYWKKRQLLGDATKTSKEYISMYSQRMKVDLQKLDFTKNLKTSYRLQDIRCCSYAVEHRKTTGFGNHQPSQISTDSPDGRTLT